MLSAHIYFTRMNNAQLTRRLAIKRRASVPFEIQLKRCHWILSNAWHWRQWKIKMSRILQAYYTNVADTINRITIGGLIKISDEECSQYRSQCKTKIWMLEQRLCLRVLKAKTTVIQQVIDTITHKCKNTDELNKMIANVLKWTENPRLPRVSLLD